MTTPAPPARVRATKPTRHSTASMPLYSASPPLTPPIIRSVLLRRSCGRAGALAGGACSHAGWSLKGAEGSAFVMGRACRPGGPETIRQPPDPSLVRPSGVSPIDPHRGSQVDGLAGRLEHRQPEVAVRVDLVAAGGGQGYRQGHRRGAPAARRGSPPGRPPR